MSGEDTVAGRGQTTRVTAPVVVVGPVRHRDLVDIDEPSAFGQLVHQVEVVGPVERGVEPPDPGHGFPPGHQGVDIGPVPPRVNGATGGRPHDPNDAPALFVGAGDHVTRGEGGDRISVGGEGVDRRREVTGVPQVVVVEGGHQLATGMLQTEVAGAGDPPLSWRTTRMRRSTAPSSASAPASGEPSSTMTSQLARS